MITPLWNVLGLAFALALSGCTAAPVPAPQPLGPDRANYCRFHDGWIYYSNFSDQERLTRIRPDGSGREVLSDRPRAALLGFDGETVYFGVFRYENGPKHDWTIDELHRVAPGAPAAQVAEVAIAFLNPGFLAAGNSVFFNGGDPNQPAAMRLDLETGRTDTLKNEPIRQAVRGPAGAVFLSCGTEPAGVERWDPGATGPVPVLDEPVQEFAVAGDGLCFASARDVAPSRKSGTGRLYRQPLAGGAPVRLDPGGSSSLQVAGDWIYYTQGGWGSLYRTRLDGSRTELLHNGQVLWPVIAGDWIYFTRGSPLEALSSKLCRVRTDGSRFQVLRKARARFVAARDDWACYVTVDDDNLFRLQPLEP